MGIPTFPASNRIDTPGQRGGAGGERERPGPDWVGYTVPAKLQMISQIHHACLHIGNRPERNVWFQ